VHIGAADILSPQSQQVAAVERDDQDREDDEAACDPVGDRFGMINLAMRSMRDASSTAVRA
jgi:hypothetical protein